MATLLSKFEPRTLKPVEIISIHQIHFFPVHSVRYPFHAASPGSADQSPTADALLDTVRAMACRGEVEQIKGVIDAYKEAQSKTVEVYFGGSPYGPAPLDQKGRAEVKSGTLTY